MLIWDDNEHIWVFIHSALSLLIVNYLNLEPAVANTYFTVIVLLLPNLAPVVPTWGSDFSDFYVASHGALCLNAILQRIQNSRLWELWHDLQVFNWYVKLGPVVGDNALTGVSKMRAKWIEQSKINIW